MNSRDADFAESLKEIIEATAAEAAAAKDGLAPNGEEATPANGEGEAQSNGKKKRKRVEEEAYVPFPRCQ